MSWPAICSALLHGFQLLFSHPAEVKIHTQMEVSDHIASQVGDDKQVLTSDPKGMFSEPKTP